MPYLKIDSKTVKVDITFNDKYVFILGDTGFECSDYYCKEVYKR